MRFDVYMLNFVVYVYSLTILSVTERHTFHFFFDVWIKVKVKSPYFTSIVRNSHPTNKPEVDGALILPIPFLSP